MLFKTIIVIISTIGCLQLFPIVESAKILAVYQTPSRSHVIIMQSLLKGLAAKGHEVTFISGFTFDKPVKNIREIVTEDNVSKAHKGCYYCLCVYFSVTIDNKQIFLILKFQRLLQSL